jgi:hypothetical protein
MTIIEAQEKRMAVEVKIAQLLTDFEKETGLSVDSIRQDSRSIEILDKDGAQEVKISRSVFVQTTLI